MAKGNVLWQKLALRTALAEDTKMAIPVPSYVEGISVNSVFSVANFFRALVSSWQTNSEFSVPSVANFSFL